MTSHDVINRLRRILSIKQIGHSGTLDPMAEGVMVVGVGKACRLLQYVPDEKTYLAEILLGQTTDTDDIEGRILSRSGDLSHIDEQTVADRLIKFLGKQSQIPPIYSAIKKGGMKMYELARKGLAPDELEARPVEIFQLQLLSFRPPYVSIRVACSKGTYIRSIARDLGSALEVGGCLSALVREKVGTFDITDSIRINDAQAEHLAAALISPALATGIHEVGVNEALAKKLMQGQCINLSSAIMLADELQSATAQLSSTKPLGNSGGNLAQSNSGSLYIACLQERPIALVSLKDSDLLKPDVVLADANEI